MEKIINPCMCEVYNGIARGFVKIQYDNNRLSISGVIGSMGGGNSKGSCGQCIDEIQNGEPKEGWNREMLDKLCQIWREWHLNDMRPYCEHQKQLGWNKLASKVVTMYHYCVTAEVSQAKRDAEQAALKALRNGESFTPSDEQFMYVSMPDSLVSHEKLSGVATMYYEPRDLIFPDFPGEDKPTEEKALGWLTQKEHPEGILGKECPVCGYKYGTKWNKEQVPQEVIDWLFSLPETTVNPAWI